MIGLRRYVRKGVHLLRRHHLVVALLVHAQDSLADQLADDLRRAFVLLGLTLGDFQLVL